MSNRAFYTIGHSNLPIEAFITALTLHSIQVVVDIRSKPFSRFHPQFNKTTLASSLAAAGIDYRLEGQDLGGRPADPACYIGGVLPARKEDFIHQIDFRLVMARPWYQEGIRRLIDLNSDQRMALLCAEEDPANCHRQHLVAQSLLAQGFEVLHIRRSGEIQPAWLDPA